MSEQEKKSGGSAISSSMVMVDKTTGSRHKQHFRPNELQEDSEIHHKRLKAPLVPSVQEELKNLTEDSTLPQNDTLPENAEIKERMECENAVIVDSDKHKQRAAKKLSSSMERREHSPESITLTPIEVDSKKGAAISLPQPIPTDVPCTGSAIKEADKKYEKKADEDSINEEIAELQTPEMAIKHSEWSDDEEAGGLPRSDSRASRVSRMHNLSSTLKKKEISWNDKKYQENIVPKEPTPKTILDRRASITPCFRPMGPHEGPSGISINLPKKSSKCVNQSSGININISRKCIASKSKITSDEHPDEETNESSLEKAEKIKCDTAFASFVDNLKEKFSNIQTKMKSVFQT